MAAKNLCTQQKKLLNLKIFSGRLSHVLRSDSSNTDAKYINIEALTALGSKQTSANGRNYYLTTALEEATDLKFHMPTEFREHLVGMFPVEFTLSAFPTLFKPEECVDRNETLYIELVDPSSQHFIQFRNGIAIVRNKIPKQWDIKLKTTVTIWKDILLGKRNVLAALATGDVTVEGGILALTAFMGCFDKDITFIER